MPPYDSHGGAAIAGVDWLSASVYGNWQPSAWKDTARRLDAAKEAALSANHSDGIVVEGPEGDSLLVKPYGMRGVNCRWLVQWRGATIAIANQPKQHATIGSAQITLPSRVVMALDWQAAWAEVLTLLRSLGFNYSRSTVSRLDFCVDLPGQDMRPFIQAFEEGRIITNARKRRIFYEREYGNGVQLGTGDIVLRIYDKAVESAHDEEKRELLIQGAWQGQVCEAAARVEFQVRGRALREMKIRSVEAVKSGLPVVIGYCCDSWCRLVAQSVDRKNNNQSRATLDPIWEKVREAFCKFAFWREPGVRERRAVALDARGLRRQALGCLARVIAVSGSRIESPRQAVAAIVEAIAEDMPEFVDWVERKRQLHQANSATENQTDSDVPF